MANDLIRYDLLVQDALRGVVRKVLQEAAKEGLPGDHHFYVTFRTTAPGVRLSNHMRAQYPDVMTIILQHQFWDLAVSDGHFEVGLSFKNIPERLLIPFEAVTEFYDPSVQFGLKFEVEEAGPEDGANDLEPIPALPGPTAVPAVPAEAKQPVSAKSLDEALATDAPSKVSGKGDAKRAKAKDDAAAAAASASDALADADPNKVVSIDAFRKKH